MADENNPGNPGDNQDGWASPTPPMGQQPPSYPPQPEQPQPYPQQGYQQYGYQQQAYPQQGYPTPPSPQKKSKLWLWITLGILIPLLLCGIGIGSCAVIGYNVASKPVDATNKFYKSMKAGENLDSQTCKAYLDQGGSFNDDLDNAYGDGSKVDSYNFNDVDITNGLATVKGTVKREGKSYDATIELRKESGKYKVCYLNEK